MFWSGGIDSSGALVALLETKSKNDVLNIRYTQDSIDEFPLMWEKMVKDKNDPLSNKEMLDDSLFENHDIIKVTGECGDRYTKIYIGTVMIGRLFFRGQRMKCFTLPQ